MRAKTALVAFGACTAVAMWVEHTTGLLVPLLIMVAVGTPLALIGVLVFITRIGHDSGLSDSLAPRDVHVHHHHTWQRHPGVPDPGPTVVVDAEIVDQPAIERTKP